MKMRNTLAALGVAVAVTVVAAGTAAASGDEEGDLTGPEAEKATSAALRATGAARPTR